MAPEIRRVLVRAPNWLGDTVMATPAVRVLRRCLPEAHLTVLAPPAFQGFWSGIEGVQAVRVLDRKGAHRGWSGLRDLARELKREDYDASLLLTESFSSAYILWAAGIPRRLGIAAQGRSFLLKPALKNPCPRRRHFVTETLTLLRDGWGLPSFARPVALEFPLVAQGKREADHLLGKRRGAYVAFIPGATYGPTKRWPVEHWLELRDRILKDTRCSIVVVGSSAEAPALEPLGSRAPGLKGRLVMAAGKTSVLGLGAVLSRCRVAVANDTGPLHVAAAVGTPVVGLYGSSSPVWTRPLGKGHQVLYHRVPCSPCFLKECPIDLRCMTSLTAAEAWTSLRPLLRGAKKAVRPERLDAEIPCSTI